MGFKPLAEIKKQGTAFNSSVSQNFKNLYENLRLAEYTKEAERKSSQTFAPSSMRCDRISYFRLRGVEPDPAVVDVPLSFKAMLGTACHEDIQRLLSSNIGSQWVEVDEYLKVTQPDLDYEIVKDGYECKISFSNPPIRFACDGILKLGEEYYLLEIKTSEYGSFTELSAPKEQHIDQVICYCALLGLHHALVFYQERSNGATKCFEVSVSDNQIQETFDRFNRVLQNVKDNIAPPRLPAGDSWCSYCKYKQRCKQWG